MIYQALIELIGEVPLGMEEFVYLLAGIVTLWLLICCFTFIGSIFKRVLEI